MKEASVAKVCVIGAGPSALSLLHFLKDSKSIEIHVYEKQGEVGGMWTCLDNWRVGTDEFGLPCHHSMYKDLWSNGPKEGLEYADYTFKQHFNKNIGSFPPRRVLKDYIIGRAKQDNIFDLIKLYHYVRNVVYDPATKKFTVKVVDLKANIDKEEIFDYVVVANGHFSTPNVPSFAGIDTFKGRVLHSHDMRGASEFAGKNLLLIGSSYSAEDISLQAIKFGAKSVTITYRSKPMGYAGWPEKFSSQKPLIKYIDGTQVHFIDETVGEYDVIMFCTGYLLSFPFLDDKIRLNSPNVQYPPLYKGVVLPTCDRIFFMAMQDLWYTFSMFDVQGLYITQVINGTISTPSQDEMESDIKKWLTHLSSMSNDHIVGYKRDIDFQSDYINDLIAITNYPHKLDCRDLLLEWEKHKYQNITTYRDQCFTSLFTNETSVPPSVPWFEAFDDSLESYLNRHV